MTGARQPATRVDAGRSATVEDLALVVQRFQRDIATLQRSIPITRTIQVTVRGANLPCLVNPELGASVTGVVLMKACKHGQETTAINVGSLNWYSSTSRTRPGVVIDLEGPDIDDETDYDLRLAFYAERS